MLVELTLYDRRPQFCSKWKTTSILFQIKKTTSIIGKMEDDLIILANGRQSQYFGKWKTTSIFCQMEDDLNIFQNGRRYQFLKIKRRLMFWQMEDDIDFF
jgi:hypothetical protein